MRISRKSDRFKKTILYDVITIKHGRSTVRIVFSRHLNRKWSEERGIHLTSMCKLFYGEDAVTYAPSVEQPPKRTPTEKQKAQAIFKQLVEISGRS